VKKADVKIGKTYVVKVSGKLQPVRITRESPYGGWVGRNEKTGREVRIRGAGRLRQELKPALAALGPATPPTDLTTPRLSPQVRGIGLAYMRLWRRQQQDAGKDSSYVAFWPAHGLCPACQGRGEVNCGSQLEPNCAACGGSGLLIAQGIAP
jgi:hypothetical protein